MDVDKRDEYVKKGKFLGRFLIEILGTPKEHVKETLEKYIATLKEDPEIEFVNEHIAEPEEKGKAFATFAEIEIWLKDLEKLFAFCLDAMPSSVEIVEPAEFKLETTTLTSMLNDLQAKMHEVDLVVKQLRIKNSTLEKNTGNLVQNMVILSTREAAKSTEQISMDVGIPEERIKIFIDRMVKEGLLEIVEGKWYKPK